MTCRFSKECLTSHENRSFVTMVLGFMTLISAAAYLIYRYNSERLYREKWKDYDDCGVV